MDGNEPRSRHSKPEVGYGLVCTEHGEPIADCRLPIADCRLPIADRIFKSANQEHGILHISGNDSRIVSRFPIGTRLRIFPNHACATGAQHPEYHAILQDGEVETWPRFYGW